MLRWLGFGFFLAIYILAIFFMPLLTPLFAPFSPDKNMVIYQITPFYKLVWNHLYLVVISEFLSIFVGVGLAVIVTRKWGSDFLPLVNNLSSIGQTIPPVAVLALAVPSLGFGGEAVLIALFLYGILPIIRNTIVALSETDRRIIEAARGQGMQDKQILLKIELPLAFPAIIAAIRTSTAIMIGTATISSTVSVKSLGEPIIAGLANFNMAYILEGAILVAILALFVDYLLKKVEIFFTSSL